MKLHKLRTVHRIVFGDNSNYQRLYPVIARLKEISFDYLSESNHIRATFNSKGLKDPGQKGYSNYQVFAILRMLADLAGDNSNMAIAKLLSRQYAGLKIVQAELAQLNDPERYSKKAIADWALAQSVKENELILR